MACAGETPPLDTSIQSQPRAFISAACSTFASSSISRTVSSPTAAGSLTSNRPRRAAGAAPAADMVDFYIYESWVAGPHKIVLHRSTCGQCNHGKGRPAGHDSNHARWHGPYPTLNEARETSHNMPGVLIRSECKCV